MQFAQVAVELGAGLVDGLERRARKLELARGFERDRRGIALEGDDFALRQLAQRLPIEPFGEPREGLKVLSIAAPPRRLIEAVPVLLAGRDAPWLAKCGYRRDDLAAFEVASPGDFVLDGEIYRGGDYAVRQGPELEFVVP